MFLKVRVRYLFMSPVRYLVLGSALGIIDITVAALPATSLGASAI